MGLIDSHAHLDFYTDDLTEVLERAEAAGVSGLLAIGIGDGPATMHRALEIATARSRDGLRIWASAGIHPQETEQATTENLAKLRELAQRPECVAVGEIGLDYYHADNPEIAVQKAAFIAQMEIAGAVKKPILIHCRTSELAQPAAKERYGDADSEADLIELVREHWVPFGVPGVMHCFSGGVEHARRSLDAGFYLSFAGNLTYPKAQGIREAAVFAPADRILVETDAPFLAPVPLRGQRNEPAYVAHTTAALAELRGVSVEEIVRVTGENFERLLRAGVGGRDQGLAARVRPAAGWALFRPTLRDEAAKDGAPGVSDHAPGWVVHNRRRWLSRAKRETKDGKNLWRQIIALMW